MIAINHFILEGAYLYYKEYIIYLFYIVEFFFLILLTYDIY